MQSYINQGFVFQKRFCWPEFRVNVSDGVIREDENKDKGKVRREWFWVMHGGWLFSR